MIFVEILSFIHFTSLKFFKVQTIKICLRVIITETDPFLVLLLSHISFSAFLLLILFMAIQKSST